MGYCGGAGVHPEVDKCQAVVNKQKIMDRLASPDCHGQSHCSLFPVGEMLFDAAKVGAPAECTIDESLFYYQYECEQPVDGPQGLNEKRQQGLVVSCIGVFVSLIYLTGMYYLSSVASIDFKAWDVGTVTASDFTVEYNIPKKVWTKFEDNHTDHTRAEGTDFEDYLKKEFENIISQQPSVLYPNLVQPPAVRIANITFAFNNAKLIGLLRQRGTIVASGNFTKLPDIDAKINDLKTHDLQSLTKPVSAFITFETQDGYERACEFKGTKKCNGEVIADREFDGAPLYFEEAPEPTNIIWENRHYTYKN